MVHHLGVKTVQKIALGSTCHYPYRVEMRDQEGATAGVMRAEPSERDWLFRSNI